MSKEDTRIMELDLYKFFSCVLLESKKVILVFLIGIAVFIYEDINVNNYHVHMGYHQNYALDNTCISLGDECEIMTLSSFPLYAIKLINEKADIVYHNPERNEITFTMSHSDPDKNMQVINKLNQKVSEKIYKNAVFQTKNLDKTFDRIAKEIGQVELMSVQIFIEKYSTEKAIHASKMSMYEDNVMFFDFVLLDSKKARPSTYKAALILVIGLMLVFIFVLRKYKSIIFY
jgi:hypothetical protein